MNCDLSRLLRPVFRFGFSIVVSWILKAEVRLGLRSRLTTELKPVPKPDFNRVVRPSLKSDVRSGLKPEVTPGVTRRLRTRVL